MANTVQDKKVSLRRVMDGIVVSIVDATTAKVRVERKFPHPKYGKIIKNHKKYLVNKNAETEIAVGDVVIIGEIKPVSKNKTWEVINKLETKK